MIADFVYNNIINIFFGFIIIELIILVLILINSIKQRKYDLIFKNISYDEKGD